MCATMGSVAWQNKLALGRFLYSAKQQGAPTSAALSIEQGCAGAVTAERLRGCMYLLVCFSCCFYALFLFDTLGDAVGASGAYWVLVVMPLIPIVLPVAVYIRNIARGSVMSRMPSASIAVGAVELGTVLQSGTDTGASVGNSNHVTAASDGVGDSVTYNAMVAPRCAME
jgi:hypothetical protein